MDSNNVSGISIDNALLDESKFSTTSSVEIDKDSKQMAEKIQNLEAELLKKKESNKFGGNLMMQIREKFGKLKNKMNGMKAAKVEEKREFEGSQKEFEKLGQEKGKLKEKLAEKKCAMIEMENGMAEMKEEIGGLKAAKEEGKVEFEGMKEENGKLKEKIDVLTEKGAKFVRELGETKGQKAGKKAHRRQVGLPAELINELFLCLPLENAVGLLAKMQNGLLEQNVHKMLKHSRMANKWNALDCDEQMLAISEDGLGVTNIDRSHNVDSLKAISPVRSFYLDAKKRPNILSYFEMQIIKTNICCVGFLTELDVLGEYYPIGIYPNYYAMLFGHYYVTHFEDCDKIDLKAGDVLGIGLIESLSNSSMQCFATFNGQLRGVAIFAQCWPTTRFCAFPPAKMPIALLLNHSPTVSDGLPRPQGRHQPKGRPIFAATLDPGGTAQGMSAHSTGGTKVRQFFERRLWSSPFLVEFVVRMFWHDFHLLGFPVPEMGFAK